MSQKVFYFVLFVLKREQCYNVVNISKEVENMRSNSEIIDIIIEEKNKQQLSLSELARRVGVAKSALSRYLNKTRQFPLNKVQTFANVLGLSSEYLLGVEISNDDAIVNDKLINVYNRLTDTNKTKVLDYSNKLLREQDSIIKEASNLYKVIAFAGLSAGKGYSYEEHEQTTVYTDRDDLKPHDFATIVHGDSMEPLYNDGDVVLISNGYDNVQGGIYAVDFNNESFLKRVYFEGNRIRLVSVNPNYSDKHIYLPIDEGTYLNIIGKVVDSFKPVQK